LSISPGPGTVTGNSVAITPTATTTYTLTAANSAGSATATTTVVVTVAAVSVSVSPASATLLTGGTQQFTATVTNAANTSVTWTATGGTVTSAGLFTAGQTSGSFQVKATSVQDSAQSGTSVVTIVTQTSSDRPRIILDVATLGTLRSRVSANTT